MKSYITKPRTILINKLNEKRHSFNPKDYRLLQLSTNHKKLSELIISVFQGQEIGSDNYLIKSKYRFLKTVNITNDFSLDEETSMEYCIPGNDRFPQKGNILIVKDGAGDGLGEVCIYTLDNSKNTDSISAGILCLDINEELKYYILGILKSYHFKDFINLETPEGSTIRHSKKIALDYNVVFPTSKNHPTHQKVQDLINLIVQNIIDKEEQIKIKNKKIDEFIEKELKENQKVNKFTYKFPSISEINKEKRLDTYVYGEKYKSLDYLVKNYNNGVFYLTEMNITPGRTPEDYYFTDKKLKNTFEWVTPKNISKRRLLYKTYLHTNNPSNTKKYSLIFSGIRYVGNCYFIEGDSEPVYSNQNTLVINYSDKLYEQVFLLSYLSSEIGKQLQCMRRVVGNVPILYTGDFVKIPIPSFTELKQQEIAKEYYNPLPKNKDLTFENYLENEKTRNNEIGIFQLNMEILKMREILEDLVDKIINEEPIELVLEY